MAEGGIRSPGYTDREEYLRNISPRNRDHQRGQHVGDLYFAGKKQIDADAGDQNIADVGQIGHRGIRHQRRCPVFERGHEALQNADGNGREGRADAENGGHRDDDGEVDDGLCEKNGVICVDAVIDGADDGHGADTYGQRCADKGADEGVIAVMAGLSLEPFAELFDSGLQIQEASDDRADKQGNHHHHGAAGSKAAAFHLQHLLHRAADADKDHHDAAGGQERLLHLVRKKSADAAPQQAPGRNRTYIYNSSETDHTFLLQNLF